MALFIEQEKHESTVRRLGIRWRVHAYRMATRLCHEKWGGFPPYAVGHTKWNRLWAPTNRVLRVGA